MARTRICAPYTADYKTVSSYVERFLIDEGFSPKDYHGEQVWKKGTGIATAMQYVKLEYTENGAVIYAWIQAGVGNVGGKEMDLTGIYGAVPKRNLLKRIQKLESIIKSL